MEASETKGKKRRRREVKKLRKREISVKLLLRPSMVKPSVLSYVFLSLPQQTDEREVDEINSKDTVRQSNIVPRKKNDHPKQKSNSAKSNQSDHREGHRKEEM